MKTALSLLWNSLTRTFVPIIAGGILGFFVSLQIEVDPEFEVALTSVLTSASAALWYFIGRVLELYVSPRFGWLLGLAKAPEQYVARHEVKR